jgi:hypothetical protein
MAGSEFQSLQLGDPLLDEYLAFVGARAQRTTWLAVAFDLKVFFSLVGKPPAEVRTPDVLGFHQSAESTSRVSRGALGRWRARGSGGDPPYRPFQQRRALADRDDERNMTFIERGARAHYIDTFVLAPG